MTSVSFEEVKQACIGRSREIVSGLLGLDPAILDKRKHCCIECKEPKMRFSKPDELVGGCDGCKTVWRGPIDLVMVCTGDNAKAAKDRLATYLGLDATGRKSSSKQPSTTKQAKAYSQVSPAELAADGYSAYKQTLKILTSERHFDEILKPTAELKAGTKFSVWRHDLGAFPGVWRQSSKSQSPQRVACVPIYGSKGLTLCNYRIYPSDPNGIKFVFKENNSDDWLVKYEPKLSALEGPDRVGISCTLAARDMISAGRPVKGLRIIKIEGESDLAALVGLLPHDEPYLVFCNSDGARSTNVASWLLPMLFKLEPTEIIIIHDQDFAGVAGAIKWANMFDSYRIGPDDRPLTHVVKNVTLPLEYRETKGPDLRDWLTTDRLAGESVSILDFERLIDETPVYTRQSEPIDTESIDDSSLPSTEAKTDESEQRVTPEPSGERPGTIELVPITSYGHMIRTFTEMRPERIQGLLRDTELLNIIAAPKIGKSYLVGGMAISIATGRSWNYTQAVDKLQTFIKRDIPLEGLRRGDAERWHRWMVHELKMSPNTSGQNVKRCRQMMRAAIDDGLIESNPFDGVKIDLKSDKTKNRFVDEAAAKEMLEACPDQEWRTIFALCRFGGLRCPSEVLSLRWTDIDFDKERCKVSSSKTARYGKGERIVPLWPEMRAELDDLSEIVQPGVKVPLTDFVIKRYRGSEQNLRTQLNRIADNAKLVKWPKPFMALRASRRTELERSGKFANHVLNAWFGHTGKVAEEHYLQVTEADFAQATNPVGPFVGPSLGNQEPPREITETQKPNKKRALMALGSLLMALQNNENTPIRIRT